MPVRKPTPTRKASGENIGEWQRRTERVVLRLSPEVAASLRARAASEEVTLSGYVARLIATDLAIV